MSEVHFACAHRFRHDVYRRIPADGGFLDDGMTVVANWSTLVGSFNTSALEFYQPVEANVQKRQAPDINFSRKNLNESHIFSSSREYPFVRRKKLTFAVCSAPYGTGQFFSWWLLEEQSLFERIMRAIPFVSRLYDAATSHIGPDPTSWTPNELVLVRLRARSGVLITRSFFVWRVLVVKALRLAGAIGVLGGCSSSTGPAALSLSVASNGVSTERVEATFRNRSDQEVQFAGCSVRLQIRVEALWQAVEPDTCVTANPVLVRTRVAPNATIIVPHPIPNGAATGVYRLTLEVIEPSTTTLVSNTFEVASR